MGPFWMQWVLGKKTMKVEKVPEKGEEVKNGMDPFPMGLTNFKKVSLVRVITDEFVG